ncbi:redox-regulated ATPase YchF [Gemmatimonadota bacterium]
MLQVGIVGLPNVGKSSLFNALTAQGAPAENYPFCTVEPNVGTVEVPDPRTRRIQELTGSREAVPTFIRFVDLAGLVKGASEGEGLGNQFLGQIREVDAIIHVLRCFEDPDVAHVMGGVDPQRDMEIVETELILADLETLERRQEKVEKKARSGEKEAIQEMVTLDCLRRVLSRGRPARSEDLSEADPAHLRSLNLLTSKPVLYVANVTEEGLGDESNPWAVEWTRKMGLGEGEGGVVRISAAIEAELALLEAHERLEFLSDLSLEEAGLDRVIHAAYRLLDLITFFTTNEKQARAWAIPRGSLAPYAGGRVHTDFERGFIRAETIGFGDFVGLGSMKAARDRGSIRSEGKDYEVQDGDIILFRFNV